MAKNPCMFCLKPSNITASNGLLTHYVCVDCIPRHKRYVAEKEVLERSKRHTDLMLLGAQPEQAFGVIIEADD